MLVRSQIPIPFGREPEPAVGRSASRMLHSSTQTGKRENDGKTFLDCEETTAPSRLNSSVPIAAQTSST